MMKTDTVLCLDIGNTRLKWGLCELSDLCLLETGVIDDVYMSSQFDLFFGLMEPRPVWISAVVSDVKKQMVSDWFKKNWNVSAEFIYSSIEGCGHLNAYKIASDLGVDRWLAMLAGQYFYKGNFCVIDAGTAITIDVVSVVGEHLGGLIMPGKQLMITSLVGGTAEIDVTGGKVTGLADCTADGVYGGVVSCIVGGIDRVLSEVMKAQEDVRIILTGGDADFIKSVMDVEVIVKKHLVLQGAGLVARNAYA